MQAHLNKFLGVNLVAQIQVPLYLVVISCFGIPLAMSIIAIPMWFICRKAGFSPWLTLLNCIPFGTPLLLLLLAAVDWKISKPRAELVRREEPTRVHTRPTLQLVVR